MRRHIVAGAGCLALLSTYDVVKFAAPVCTTCNNEQYLLNGDACQMCNLHAEPRKVEK